MLGTIFYAVGCFFAAAVLATILVVFRPMHKRDELKPWKTFIFSFIFCLAAPFGYCEILTRAFSTPMVGAIDKAYAQSGINGAMRYYRLTSYGGDSAQVLIVGTDNQSWGGKESPVISVSLSKNSHGDWKADSYRILSSGRLNQDAFVFPPYY